MQSKDAAAHGCTSFKSYPVKVLPGSWWVIGTAALRSGSRTLTRGLGATRYASAACAAGSAGQQRLEEHTDAPGSSAWPRDDVVQNAKSVSENSVGGATPWPQGPQLPASRVPQAVGLGCRSARWRWPFGFDSTP